MFPNLLVKKPLNIKHKVNQEGLSKCFTQYKIILTPRKNESNLYFSLKFVLLVINYHTVPNITQQKV